MRDKPIIGRAGEPYRQGGPRRPDTPGSAHREAPSRSFHAYTEDSMTTPLVPARIQRILVPTNFSSRADAAFALGLHLARRLGAEVVLFHVLTPLETDVWSPLYYIPEEKVLRDDLDAIITRLLDDVMARHDTDGVPVTRRITRGNLAAPAIVAGAADVEADLVVMGTHGRRGLRRALLGSVADEVVRTADCPVLLAREGATAPHPEAIERILLPVDMSDDGWAALPLADALARACGAQMDLLHVVDVFPTSGLYGLYYAPAAEIMPHVAAQARTDMQPCLDALAAAGTVAAAHVEIGPPGDGIVHFAGAHPVDLIVMASHGHTGLTRFMLGGVAEKVTHAAPCPVLVVPAGKGGARADARAGEKAVSGAS